MPNFVSISECLNSPSAECLVGPGSAFAVLLALVLAIIGWRMAASDGRRFKRAIGRALVLALSLLLLSSAGVFAFFALRPDAPLGVEKVPAYQMMWLAVIYGFSAGALLLAGALGLTFGGLAARLSGHATRIGKPGIVIAIDGPAASGKGTLAKRIAAHFRMPVLDTGLLYRAVARDVLARGGKLDDTAAAVAAAKALDPKTFEDENLRGEKAGEAASVVARIPEVRAALLDYQRDFAKNSRGAVLDGRDIGTVVCPDAQVKIFVTASPEVRARRRHKEHEARGDGITFEAVLEDIHRRDARDMGREIAPLWPAHDAITLDTSDRDAEQAFREALRIIDFRVNGEA